MEFYPDERGQARLPYPEAFGPARRPYLKGFQLGIITRLRSARGGEGGLAPAPASQREMVGSPEYL